MNALIMAITVPIVMMFAAVTLELRSFAQLSTKSDLARLLLTPRMLAADDGLPVSLQTTLKDIEGIKAVSLYTVIAGRHASGATYLIAGEQDTGLELTRDFFPVDPAVVDAWKQEKRLGAIVTPETFRDLGLSVGQLVELPTEYGPIQIKVVGISRKGLIGHRIAVHLEYLQELIKNTQICNYRVYTAPSDVDRVAKAIIERTERTPTPARVFSDSQFTTSWVKRVSIVPALLGFLGAFLILTTILTLANNTAISIRERGTEIATLRTVGFRKKAIARIIVSEVLLVSLLGALVSIAVALVVLRHGVQLTPGADRLLQKVVLGPFAVGCGLLTAIVVPLAGTVPAARAALRKPIVSGLRDRA